MNSNIVCSKCILDTTIEEIEFDSNGVCNYCHTHEMMEKKFPLGQEGDATVNKIVAKIKEKGKNKKYDCIVGVSGGRDSTYTLYKAVKLGLRPLAVHFDNGWNSDIAVKNINNATRILNVDLETIVADWEEFKDLQVSFLKASVSDAEVPTDWVIFSILFETAKKIGVKYIIHGHSFRTEGSTPLSWTYMDGKYVKSVHRIFGKKKIKSFPIMNMFSFFKYSIFYRIKQVRLLYHISYDEKKVFKLMQDELGWQDYGGKHFESAYTSIFQSYILMNKFNIDKRKLHLSALIRCNQVTRDEALLKISSDPFVGGEKQIKFTVKKLGLKMSEFEEIMSSEVKSYKDYPTYYSLIKKLEKPIRFANKLNLVPDSVINKYY
tara:strand:+ start:980 stop:2110 length:1131 start_codon:yes stop_codon:yes gene_type:complete